MAPTTADASSSASVGISEDAALIRKVVEYFDAVDKREEARLLETPLQGNREATVVAVIGEVGCGKTMLVDALSGNTPTALSESEKDFSFGFFEGENSSQDSAALGEGTIRSGESLADNSFIDCLVLMVRTRRFQKLRLPLPVTPVLWCLCWRQRLRLPNQNLSR